MDRMVRLLKVDAAANSNKFWEASTNGRDLTLRWGRIGTNGQSRHYPGKAHEFDKRVAKQRREGYDYPRTSEAAPVVNTSAVADAIRALASLVDIRVVEGRLSTSLGPVDPSVIAQARRILGSLPGASGYRRIELVNQYLTLIPQKVKVVNPVTFTSPSMLHKQGRVLDLITAILAAPVEEEAELELDWPLSELEQVEFTSRPSGRSFYLDDDD